MLAPPWMPIPPPRYGGIETVIAMLTDKLVDRRNLPENFPPAEVVQDVSIEEIAQKRSRGTQTELT